MLLACFSKSHDVDFRDATPRLGLVHDALQHFLHSNDRQIVAATFLPMSKSSHRCNAYSQNPYKDFRAFLASGQSTAAVTLQILTSPVLNLNSSEKSTHGSLIFAALPVATCKEQKPYFLSPTHRVASQAASALPLRACQEARRSRDDWDY